MYNWSLQSDGSDLSSTQVLNKVPLNNVLKTHDDGKDEKIDIDLIKEEQERVAKRGAELNKNQKELWRDVRNIYFYYKFYQKCQIEECNKDAEYGEGDEMEPKYCQEHNKSEQMKADYTFDSE